MQNKESSEPVTIDASQIRFSVPVKGIATKVDPIDLALQRIRVECGMAKHYRDDLQAIYDSVFAAFGTSGTHRNIMVFPDDCRQNLTPKELVLHLIDKIKGQS